MGKLSHVSLSHQDVFGSKCVFYNIGCGHVWAKAGMANATVSNSAWQRFARFRVGQWHAQALHARGSESRFFLACRGLSKEICSAQGFPVFPFLGDIAQRNTTRENNHK